MTKIYRSVAILCLLLSTAQSIAQVQTPRFNTTINANCNGFYEYLPQGYNPANAATYPLIIFVHGLSETGNGSNGQLQKVLVNGIPKLINNGTFPTSFTLPSQPSVTHRFIVISPQFRGWPAPADLNAVLDYAIANYKVNINRVYVTGLSMGGGATWEFAGHLDVHSKRIAAIVPVCGASWPEPQRAYKIAANDVAVWATHNLGDQTVPVHYTNDYIMHINGAPNPPAVPAKKTIFNSSSHDAWSTTYNPTFTEGGLNIYQWMLQFQRALAGPLPVTLTSYKAYKSSPAQGTIAWTTGSEINNSHFTIERSDNGVDFTEIVTIPANATNNYSASDDKPLKGDNYYRLSQTDIDGKKTYFSILKLRFDTKSKQVFVISPNPAFNDLQVKLEQEEKGSISVSVIGMNGTVVKQWSFQKSNYEWNQTIHVDGIPAGSYILEVKGKTFKETQRFIKN